MRAAQYEPVSVHSTKNALRLMNVHTQTTGQVSIKNIDKPACAADEILVKIIAASLCHSDLVSTAAYLTYLTSSTLRAVIPEFDCGVRSLDVYNGTDASRRG